MPKFEEQDKYTQEIEKVVKELKVLDLKNKIKVIAQAINKRRRKEEALGLQRQLSGLLKILQGLSQASKNGAGVIK